MSVIGELKAILKIDMPGVESNIKRFQQYLRGIEQSVGRPRDALGRFQKAGNGLGETLKKLGQNALSVAAGMGIFNGLTSAIQGLVSTGVGWNQSMEVSAAKWETLLGSAEAAQAQLKWMADFAAATPFEFAELDNASARLKAFGFTIGQTQSLLQTLGDTAAATGKGTVALDALANSLGKIQGMGKVTTEAMNMMSDQGINGFKILAEALGTSEAKVRDMIEKGLLPAGKAIPILQKGLDKAFGGAMQKQAETFTGKISTLQDNVKMLLGDAFKPAFGWLSGTALPFAISMVDKLTAGFKEGGFMGAIKSAFGPQIAALVQNITGGVKVLFEAIMQVGKIAAPATKAALGGLVSVIGATFGWIAEHGELVKAIVLGIAAGMAVYAARQAYFTGVAKLAAAAQWALNLAMNANPIGLIIAAIAALVAAGYLLIKNWDTVKRIALNVWGQIKAFILNAIAALIDYYARFVGLINKGWAESMRATADGLRQQAAEEKALAQERNDAAAEEAAARKEAERLKAEAAEKGAADATSAYQGMGNAAGDVWAGMADAAEDSTGRQEEYLDEFTKAFDRAQEDAITSMDRRFQAEQTALERQQDDRLSRMEKAQAEEMDALEKTQAEKLKVFEQGLDDEKTAKKRELEDILAYQEEVWDNERTAFKRSQEDQLDTFKGRMTEEMSLLKKRQEAELEAVDEEYRKRKKAIQDQIDALQDQEKAAQNASKIDGLQQGVTQAKDDVTRAEMTGDSVAIFRAKQKLSEAEQKLAEEQARQARDAQIDGLKKQLDAVGEEAQQKKDALKEKFEQEQEALKASQDERLKAYQRELEDQATHFQLMQDLQKEAFKRKQEDEMQEFERAQQARLADFKQQQEDEKKQLEEWHKYLRDFLKRTNEEEMTVLKQRQEDLKTQYSRELQDLKDSLRDKLEAQRRYLADLKRLQAEIAGVDPTKGGTAASTSTGTAGSLPKFADGAVVNQPTLGIFGEAGPEAITPLDWLLSTIRGVARDVAYRVASLKDPSGRSAGGSAAAAAQAALMRQPPDVTQQVFQFAAGAITIPAKDLAEMRSIQDFFARITQAARAKTGEA